MPYQDKQSAVVWSFNASDVQDFESLNQEQMANKLQRACRGLLGNITLLSQPHKIAIKTLKAHSLIAPRFILMAEAAHVLPAFGAQGLNTSLADIAVLAQCLDQQKDPANSATLKAYEKKRQSDINTRFTMTSGLNSILCRQDFLAQRLRTLGFTILNTAQWPRLLLMNAGMRPLAHIGDRL